MDILTKPITVDTGKVLINIRLLLNDSEKTIKIIVTNGTDKVAIDLTKYIYQYNNINDELNNIQEYIQTILKSQVIKHTPDDVTQLIKYLKEDLANKTPASERIDKNNTKFVEIYNKAKSSKKNKKIEKISKEKAIRQILIENYQDIISKINNGETKELVLDCEDFNITIEDNSAKFPLTDMLQNKYSYFISVLRNELDKLIQIKEKTSNNPYEDKGEDDEPYYLRFKNLEETPLKNMLSDRLGKFSQIQGVVSGVYEPTPKLKEGVFECMGCLRIQSLKQDPKNDRIQEPSLCTECGSKSFRLIEEESDYTTQRTLLITENQELGQQPRNLQVNLVGNKDFINKVAVGDRVNITGVLESIPNKNKKDFVFMANHIDKLDDKTINLTDNEKREFEKLSKRDDILDILVDSFAPELILPSELKEGLLCYLVKAPDTLKELPMIHILIITDPAMAKSKLKLQTIVLTEKGILASGTGASGVGLTGATVKDPLTNNWITTAGAIPLANNGHCILDEIDKLNKEDGTRLNNFMESGQDEFNKAGVNITLEGRTSILGLGNPKYGRYDKYKSLQDQLDLDPTLQSRFDLIFLLTDDVNETKDRKIISSILNDYEDKTSTVTPEDQLNPETLRKYLAYARNEFNPTITPEARDYITDYGVKARSNEDPDDDNIIHMDFRGIRSYIKLAGAIAKLHLRDEITLEDVEEAVKLKEYSLNLVGIDPITNTIDIDRFTGFGNTENKRQRNIILKIIKDYIQDPNNEDGEGIPTSILSSKYSKESGQSEPTFYRRLKELKDAGDIVESGKGRAKRYKLK